MKRSIDSAIKQSAFFCGKVPKAAAKTRCR
jgi:hypothetical protein